MNNSKNDGRTDDARDNSLDGDRFTDEMQRGQKQADARSGVVTAPDHGPQDEVSDLS